MKQHARLSSILTAAVLAACAGDDSTRSGDAGDNAMPHDMSDDELDGGSCDQGNPSCPSEDGGEAADAGPDGDPMKVAVCGEPLPNECGPVKGACAAGQACFDGVCKTPFTSRVWLGDLDLPLSPDGINSQPEMAINAAGSAAVVFDPDLGGQLALTLFDARTRTWSEPIAVTAPDAINANGEDVVVDPSGNVYVAWQEGDNDARYSKARRYDAKTKTFEAAVPLHEGPIDFMEARLASDPSGNIFLLYSNFPRVDAQRYDAATGKWGSAVRIDLQNGNGGGDIDLVVDRFGAATAVWVQKRVEAEDEWYNTYVSRFDPSSKSWSKPARIDVNDTGNDNHPSLSVDSFGNVVVVLQEAVMYDYTTIWAARYDAACAKWGTTVRIDDGTGSDLYYPAVGMDAKGNALATWTQDSRVGSASYDASSDTWTNRGTLASSSVGEDLRLAVDASGHAVAVYRGYSEEIVQHSRFDPVQGAWSAPVAIDRGSTGRSRQPRIGVDGQGRFVSVWSQFSSMKYKIRSNRFE